MSRKHAIKLRPYKQTLLPAKPNKMRNAKVWECQSCNMTGTPLPGQKKPQCGNCGKRTLVCHASKKEYERWLALKDRQKHGEIRNLKRQVHIPLTVNGVQLKTPKGRNMVYTADFTYEENRGAALVGGGVVGIYAPGPGGKTILWAKIIEDTKGRKSGNAYDLYWLKREILRANGVDVREI